MYVYMHIDIGCTHAFVNVDKTTKLNIRSHIQMYPGYHRTYTLTDIWMNYMQL
jgi:hypothetical protein